MSRSTLLLLALEEVKGFTRSRFGLVGAALALTLAVAAVAVVPTVTADMDDSQPVLVSGGGDDGGESRPLWSARGFVGYFAAETDAVHGQP